MGFDVDSIIKTVGYFGLFLIIFAETGLLLGFFLPGDTLLISAGLLIQQDKVNLELWFLIPLLIAAAILGDAVGYQIGKHTGPRLFKRADGRIFKREHLDRAKRFYDKHGGKTIVIARFLAFIRTFAPTVAGAAEMPYARFAAFNAIGAILWVPSLTFLGYFFGKAIPANLVDVFFVGLLGVMVLASVIPALIHLWRQRRRANSAA
ncbi:MAG: VTT domain-containing protein [Tepidiformaceae bacterium]